MKNNLEREPNIDYVNKTLGERKRSERKTQKSLSDFVKEIWLSSEIV